MQSVPTGLRTHSQKVCSFYKRAVRNLEAWYTDYARCRLEVCKLRKELDDNANIKDLRLAKHKLEKAEEFLEGIWHYQQKIFPYSPGGVAYGRKVTLPDWVLDFWDPMEKAFYPKYFALREQRKKEYVKFFEKQYPDVKKDVDSHH